MKIIADTNIFIAVVLDEPTKKRIIGLTSEQEAFSPLILPYEIGNALSAMVKRNNISNDDALAAFEATKKIDVKLLPVNIE